MPFLIIALFIEIGALAGYYHTGNSAGVLGTFCVLAITGVAAATIWEKRQTP